MPWMPIPIRIMIRHKDADPTVRPNPDSTTLRRILNIISVDFSLIYLKQDQFFTKIVRAGDYGTVNVCDGNDSKFRKNIRHDLFFFI
jgi:hypothetical protein